MEGDAVLVPDIITTATRAQATEVITTEDITKVIIIQIPTTRMAGITQTILGKIILQNNLQNRQSF